MSEGSIFSKIATFVKDWSLPIGMAAGAAGFLFYDWLPLNDGTRDVTHTVVSILQPSLIFAMLYLSFCKIDPSELKPFPWDKWLLLIQGGSFSLLAVVLLFAGKLETRILIEGAMLAMICPTATAAAVVTDKLGGEPAHIVGYTILINLLVSLLIPLICPIIHPQEGMTFIHSFILMLGKVFPMLICPLILAIVTRLFAPDLHSMILRHPNLAFIIWTISLPLAIAVAVKCMMASGVSVWIFVVLGVISGAACALQFFLGRKIGSAYGDEISAGQALGQKNTVFIIWLGYTFFTPVTAAVGGLYSIFHNIFNSWQLYKKRKESEI